MKMFVYGLREYDERVYFDEFSKKYNVEFASCGEKPTLENADLAAGCDAINILTAPVDKAMIDKYCEMGIRCIATRTIGYDHIDYNYAREKGIGVLNITYSPATVADYAVMMILLGIRKLKYIRLRAEVQDYTLEGKLACELGNLTVGIVGTGRIGACLAHELTGFGCRMLATDPFPKEELKDIVEYTDLDTLLRESDVITLHAPAIEENYHMIDADAFAKMKKGTGLVNCARGPLVDSDAMIDAIESGHLGFACLDTVENEFGMYYYNRMGEPLNNPQLAILNSHPNVITTPHMAFYTKEAVSDMVENSILGLLDYFK
ncbi:MAG: lactate dehydrogenase [Firmicutes bacterium]|nr:lactate dehydrogenase [Bacillota bacterium]